MRSEKAWRKTAIAVVVQTLALSGAAIAQTNATQASNDAPLPTLPTITVSAAAPAEGSLTVPGVARQRDTLFQSAGSVGFVDAQSYTDTYASNLRDVLKDSPGVYVQERYGQELRLSIRGSGISRGFHTRGLEILQDSVPTNFADGSGDYYQIDPIGLSAAEVYKGGNGLAFGSSTLGGAVNFTTPTALTADAPNMLRVDGGSFGTARASGQVSRQIGAFDFLANLSVNHSEGYRNHERGQYEQLNANFGYRFSPAVETRFYFGAYVVDQLLPGTLTLNEALNDPRKASASALAGDQARNTRTERLANVTSVKLDNGQLDFSTWIIHKSLYHPIFQVIDQDYWTYGFAPRYTGNFTLGGMRNQLIAGARFFGGNNNARQYVNVNGDRGAQTLNARQDAFNYEAYLEDRLYVRPTVALMAGAKAYRNRREYQDYGGLSASPTAKSDSATYSGVNPKFGVLWEPRKDVQAFVDITRSADVPDFSDLNQTIGATNQFVPLAQQRGWTVEAGTRGQLDRFGWDLTLYRSLVRDQMLQYTVSPDVPASTFNANRTILQGVELGASAEILRNIIGAGDRLTLSQMWNYSDFRFDNDPVYGNNRIAGVPQHVLRTTVAYNRGSALRVAGTIDWVPTGAYVDYANTMKVPAYVLFGIQASYEFQRGVTLFLDARNLADKRYVSDFGTVANARTANTAVFYPGVGRALYAGVKYKF
ncbi:iron complex outermembrane recepter protein [Cupriavidus sp. OV038]|jgi:iron complex outermembrane receptor protein|uniref:TonB-dependent receptor family protein n=1 Tax=unclassified Cupriavidus TaxID=2640874 RepID=UPI0008E7EF37|nr:MULTISPECIES: TonB-dependent receptor [unclassified Cupriavidus]SFD05790.1 iron complex outermembrane recepter protein [Cupriavidus sp. OV038]SFP72186.1 iron complex outermembrane recepter protein [Cupriavidus sp. OV096]